LAWRGGSGGAVGEYEAAHLQLDLVAVPEARPRDLDGLVRARQHLLCPILPRLRELPLAELAEAEARAGGLPHQQTDVDHADVFVVPA
jgi:hypothetical protein